MRHDSEVLRIARSLSARNKLSGLVCGYYISTYGQGGSYQMVSLNIASIVGVEKEIRCGGCFKLLKGNSSINRIDCYLARINRTLAVFVHQKDKCDTNGKKFILFLADLIAPLNNWIKKKARQVASQTHCLQQPKKNCQHGGSNTRPLPHFYTKYKGNATTAVLRWPTDYKHTMLRENSVPISTSTKSRILKI